MAQRVMVAEEDFPDKHNPPDGTWVIGDGDNVQIRLQQFNEGVGFKNWIRGAMPGQVLELLKSILASNSRIIWTGWRVTSTVRTGYRFPVYRLELFAKAKDKMS